MLILSHIPALKRRRAPRAVAAGLLTFAFAGASAVIADVPPTPPPVAAPVPAGAAAPAYSLDDCLKLALNDDFLVRRQALTLDQAQNKDTQTRTLLGPSYSSRLVLKAHSDRNLQDSASDQLSFIGERFRVGLSVSYPVYDSGVHRTEIEIADESLADTKLNQQNERNSVLVETASAYFNLLEAQRLNASAQRQFAQTQENAAGVDVRLAAGTVTRGDQLAAQSEVSSSQANVSHRQYSLATAKSRLALILGLDDQADTIAVQEPTLPPYNAPAGDVSQTALGQNLEYKLLLTHRTVAEQELRLIRQQQGPTLALTGGVGVADRGTLGNASQRTKPYAVIGLNATLPLLSRTATRAHEREQRDAIELSQLRVDDFRRNFFSRIKLLRQNYDTTSLEVNAATQSTAKAEEALRLAQERYAVGRATQLEVLGALNQLETSRDRLANSQGSRDQQAIELRVLLGEFAAPPAPPVAVTLSSEKHK